MIVGTVGISNSNFDSIWPTATGCESRYQFGHDLKTQVRLQLLITGETKH